MKKFSMIIFTIIICSITFLLYLYENTNLPDIQYKTPKMSFYSNRFGEVNNLTSLPRHGDPLLFILSNDNEKNESKFYSLDLSNNKIQLMKSFEPHDKFKDTLIFNDFDYIIITANKTGLNLDKLRLNRKDEYYLDESTLSIDDFSHVNNFSYFDSIYYSKDNDNLIHKKDPDYSSFDFFNSTNQYDFSYYKKPHSIIQARTLNDIVYYTKLNKNGLHLYEFSTKNNKNFSEKLLVNNFIYGNYIKSDDGICGIYEKDNKFIIFIKNAYKDLINIDKIPKNTDSLGQVPSLFANAGRNNYVIAYTSFDENHLGKIHIKKNTDESPIVIVKDEAIIGSIKIINYTIDDVYYEKILFTTLEKEKTKIKLCDLETYEIEDITHYFE